jgi:hypothetical protein
VKLAQMTRLKKPAFKNSSAFISSFTIP